MTELDTATVSTDQLPRKKGDELCLVALSGEQKGLVIPFRGPRIQLGRQPTGEGAVTIADSQLSREHAMIQRIASGYYTVSDAESKNGTWHNGLLADGRLLQPQDILRAGRTVFVVREQPSGRKSKEPRDALHKSLRGESEAVKAARDLIRRSATSNSTILILGETGTGKEVAALGIHNHSKCRGEFIAVNCAAIPAQLLERELFGNMRGAYTGAAKQAEGYVGAAENGTLFLDEIGELAEAVQAKLLRFLESHEYTPVGAARSKTANVRVVAATNKNLLRMVENGMFREDLYARLDDIVIELVPLRARKDDIPLLLDTIQQRLFPKSYGLTADFLEALMLYNWPRNIRELIKVIKRIPMRRDNVQSFEIADLPEPLMEPLRRRDGQTRVSQNPRKHDLIELLRKFGGRIKPLADAVGRDRKTIYRWIRQYDIDIEPFRK